MDKQAVLDTLKELIQTSENGQRDFSQASEKVTEPTLKSELYNRAHLCAKAAQDLQGLALSLDKEPDRDGRPPDAAQCGGVAVKAAFSASDTGVLAALERSEDQAREVYQHALSQELPAPVRMMVEEQHQGVVGNHDRVRSLRDGFEHAA